MEPNAALSVFTSSAIVVWLIQQLKASKYFPWITAETAKLNRFASIVLAALTSAGLGWQWSHATHTLTITNLTWAVVGAAAWHAVQHFTLQEAIYRSTQRKVTNLAPQATTVNVTGPVSVRPADVAKLVILFLLLAGVASAQAVPTGLKATPLPTFPKIASIEVEKPFAARAYAATAILYAQDGEGNLRMECTTTAYKKLPDGYLFVTASHCVSDQDDDAIETRDGGKIKLDPTRNFLTFDDPSDKELFKAEVVVAGLQTKGDDFAILRVRTTKDLPIIPLGDESLEETGNKVLNIASPLGLGRQTMSGYISMKKLDRPVKQDAINWEDCIVLQIGVGPGSSGSSILSTSQEAIIGFLVGTVGAQNVIAIPVSKFKAFATTVSEKKYKWYPAENLPKDMPALQ